MKPIQTVSSLAAPLRRNDVDTDQIIPAAFLTSVSREGYGENLFRGLREADPNFILDQPTYRAAEILVVGSNFGCGSSREHAVWALTGRGIRAIVGKSFADIFSGNSAKNGLLLVTLPEHEVDALFAAAEQSPISLTVSLADQVVTLPDGRCLGFDYDPFRKHCLLNGLDDIDYINSRKAEISAFRQAQMRSW
jgi:3-isopropylmalate/(R)-2-methylmalate dehydratase small subunit